MRVKVEQPKELGASYVKGDILEVSADKAARWKAHGLVSYVDANSPDSKKPTKAEVEEEPRGGDAAPVYVVHTGGPGDPARALRHEGQEVLDLSPEVKTADKAILEEPALLDDLKDPKLTKAEKAEAKKTEAAKKPGKP